MIKPNNKESNRKVIRRVWKNPGNCKIKIIRKRTLYIYKLSKSVKIKKHPLHSSAISYTKILYVCVEKPKEWEYIKSRGSCAVESIGWLGGWLVIKEYVCWRAMHFIPLIFLLVCLIWASQKQKNQEKRMKWGKEDWIDSGRWRRGHRLFRFARSNDPHPVQCNGIIKVHSFLFRFFVSKILSLHQYTHVHFSSIYCKYTTSLQMGWYNSTIF